MIFGSARVSVAGSEWADVATVAGTTAAQPAAADINSAHELAAAEYMGILVNLECDGTCSISGATLVGDWTVEADSAAQKWTRTGTGDFVTADYAE